MSKRYRLYTERRTALRERFVRMAGSPYEDFWALRDVDFDVDRGQTFGVIGHNGSGKSTLLRLMAGIHRPTEGIVTARGRVGALLELGAGFHPDLTGRENVRLNAAILGIPQKYIDARMDEIAEFAGVERFFDSPLKVYSSGMAMRLGFATAVHIEPGHPARRRGHRRRRRGVPAQVHGPHLTGCGRDGSTIVLVSHSLPLVAELCDAALWLDGGQPQMVGQTDMVIDAYLEEVNTREAEAAEQAAADEGATRGRRSAPTSAAARSASATLSSSTADGRAVDTLLAGEPATVRIHYEAQRADGRHHVRPRVRHRDRHPGRGPEQRLRHRCSPMCEPGSGSVEFQVDRAAAPARPLSRVGGGRHAAARRRPHGGRVRLVVRAAHAITEPGLVRLPGDWTVAPSRDALTMDFRISYAQNREDFLIAAFFPDVRPVTTSTSAPGIPTSCR